MEGLTGASIFLDEIGELPLDLQTKLLRVLQEGVFEWLGRPHAVKVDVRVINRCGPKLRLADELGGPVRNDRSPSLKSLPEIEKDHILGVLQSTGWRIEGDKGAAFILDMNPSTLRSRMRKLGIRKP